VIGRVGTTGASTGYHLHFEVRLDGRPSQPLQWLPSCLC
jgi:murein DD-endopeptidase MepM/ murein hydrolase activator NlpD